MRPGLFSGPIRPMNSDVEAGLMTLLVGVSVALSLGLAFGVLQVTVHAIFRS
jgi:hypothetical protein